MTFLPIVERELIAASRRRGTYRIRLFAATAGLVLGGWILLLPEARSPQTLGMSLFVPLSVITFGYCLFVGALRTADCLSEEKREGTLGLLFLTDLRGYDIIFGKLVATSINAFYGILALFPVMAIPLLVGGVTVGEFWRVVLVSLNTLFFSLAVGMFFSAISRDERRALVTTIVTLLFFSGGLPVLARLLKDWTPTRALGDFLFIPSPSYAAVMAFDATYSKGSISKDFLPSVLVTL